MSFISSVFNCELKRVFVLGGGEENECLGSLAFTDCLLKMDCSKGFLNFYMIGRNIYEVARRTGNLCLYLILSGIRNLITRAIMRVKLIEKIGEQYQDFFSEHVLIGHRKDDLIQGVRF